MQTCCLASAAVHFCFNKDL